MQIQAAIDRVSVETASEIISEIMDCSDIIEIGTSLIKEYGLTGSVGVLKNKYPELKLLADIKTCDEGAYEFQHAYSAGADLATVMGFSAHSTIRACADTARAFERNYMIDLLETDSERIKALAREFPDAIFAIHLPSDQAGKGLEELVRKEVSLLGRDKIVAAAGGIQASQIRLMQDCGIDIAIVGSGITKAENRREAAMEFHRLATL